MLALSVVPVLAALAALLLWCWPWAPFAEHLLLLGLLGSILDGHLSEWLSQNSFHLLLPARKIESPHGVLVRHYPAAVAINKAVELERRAMASPKTYCCLALILGAIAAAVRTVSIMSTKQNGPEIQFEESASDELIGLGLNG